MVPIQALAANASANDARNYILIHIFEGTDMKINR
jgi:hypothetical protein